MIDGNKVLFSGMQATGNLTLGNYLGALKNWVNLSDEYQCFYSVVDLHSITIRQDPAELRRRARSLLTLYIAAGLDPEKNCIYYQSHVSGHAELSWILNCFTYMGELNRMTQYKDKAAKHADNPRPYRRMACPQLGSDHAWTRGKYLPLSHPSDMPLAVASNLMRNQTLDGSSADNAIGPHER